MMKLYSLLITSFTVGLIGCGAEEEAKEVVKEETIITPVKPSQPSKMTSELVTTPEFTFTSGSELTVKIGPAPSGSTRYFINICTKFTQSDEQIDIDYKSCKLRTGLTTQSQQFTLALSSNELELVAQIWPIKNSAKPLDYFFNLSDSGNQWEITL